MAEINHEIKINASTHTIYQAISTLKGLRSWHSSEIEGDSKLNHIIITKGENNPDFHWKIIELVPDEKLVWECISGPGDSVGTKAVFKISSADKGRSMVEFSHLNWPGEHGNYRKCNTLWGVMLHHLKEYSETGIGKPAFH